MDGNRRGSMRTRRNARTPTRAPPPPPLLPQGDSGQLFTMVRDMMTMMQQQQQQTQQMLMQQQQHFFEQFAPRAEPGVAHGRHNHNNMREVKLPDFIKLAPPFTGKSTDPAAAEIWVNEVEKAFSAGNVPDESKMPLAEFQLKEHAHDWWSTEKLNLREQVTWERFKEMFYEKYFPSSTRDKMLGQLLSLQQGDKSLAEYEMEFNRLIKFTPPEIKDNERTRVQKFRDGLNLKLQHDTQGHDLTTLGALVNKAKMMEETRDKLKAQKNRQKGITGKDLLGLSRIVSLKLVLVLG